MIHGGTVHNLPKDLKETLSDTGLVDMWESLTPLARNEWICWTISVSQQKTRDDHVRRVVSELKEGMKRPCCWLGCIHRKDKKISPSVQSILSKKRKKGL